MVKSKKVPLPITNELLRDYYAHINAPTTQIPPYSPSTSASPPSLPAL